MQIKTNKGEIIKTDEAPRWNEFHQGFYAEGYRFIKTRQSFSQSRLLHSFKSYEAICEERV